MGRKLLDHEAIKAYFAEGHSAKETAEKFGTTREYASKICRGIRSGNQYTNGLFDREANAIRYISERTPNFEYAGNFTGIDGYVDLKCKTCGSVIRKSFVSVRHGSARCDVCYRKELEQRREERKQERAEINTWNKKVRPYRTLLKKAKEQVTLKTCPICGALFVGAKTYCSTECRHQNKWAMRDGYRYRFPLEEVYRRDGGICYICGGLCDWNDYEIVNGVKIYGNNYPSRDHVIPKSKGGLNTWENIKLAHRICNTRKGNIPIYEKMA